MQKCRLPFIYAIICTIPRPVKKQNKKDPNNRESQIHTSHTEHQDWPHHSCPATRGASPPSLPPAPPPGRQPELLAPPRPFPHSQWGAPHRPSETAGSRLSITRGCSRAATPSPSSFAFSLCLRAARMRTRPAPGPAASGSPSLPFLSRVARLPAALPTPLFVRVPLPGAERSCCSGPGCARTRMWSG